MSFQTFVTSITHKTEHLVRLGLPVEIPIILLTRRRKVSDKDLFLPAHTLVFTSETVEDAAAENPDDLI